MTCALFLTQYLHSTYFRDITRGSLSEADAPGRKKMYEYFGTFDRCMLSMFEITLANWPPIARLLTEEISQWCSVLCVLHKLSIGFAVIGVINGVILQETFKVAQTDDMVMVRQKKRAKRAFREKMEVLFEALDLDVDGELRFPEFMVIAAQPEMKLWLESLDIETDDLLTLFMLIDADGDGTLTAEELLTQVPRLRGTARGIDMLAVRKGIPSFQFLQQNVGEDIEHKKFSWAKSPDFSSDSLGMIEAQKFTWDESEQCNENGSSLDRLWRAASNAKPWAQGSD